MFTVLWSNHACWGVCAVHVHYLRSDGTYIIQRCTSSHRGSGIKTSLSLTSGQNDTKSFSPSHFLDHQTASNEEDFISSDIRQHPICSTQSGGTAGTTRRARVCGRWVFLFFRTVVKYQRTNCSTVTPLRGCQCIGPLGAPLRIHAPMGTS